MLMEKLNGQVVHAPDDLTRDKINELASLLQLHRPAASNGKHGELHTPTCGCEDTPQEKS
ncbi:hypothetical protein BJI47_22685 [Rhodococcus sp. 1168]|nr:hypothetical protein BJI47_22685 [Rhodococcus sp. 1168]